MTTPELNPYVAPKSDVNVESPIVPGGSIEDAMAGRYDFEIGEVMSRAWELTKGFKASFWGAGILVGVAYLGLFFATSFVTVAFTGGQPNFVLSVVVQLALAALTSPLWVGLFMMAVRRAAGRPASFSTAFAFFDKSGPAMLSTILSTVFVYLGLALFVLPGIYLSVAYKMRFALIGDQDLSAWKAMEASRKSIAHKWFRVFGLTFLVGIIVGLSALPLFIPLIWTVPWSLMTLGVLYQRIFGAPARPA